MNNAGRRNPTSGVIDRDGSDQFDARRREFRTLHEEGCFVMPNPWDVGSARYLRHLGFPALGVRRISVGPALALAAWGGFMRAAQALKSDGSFAGFAGLAPFADINDLLAAELPMRGL